MDKQGPLFSAHPVYEPVVRLRMHAAGQSAWVGIQLIVAGELMAGMG